MLDIEKLVSLLVMAWVLGHRRAGQPATRIYRSEVSAGLLKELKPILNAKDLLKAKEAIGRLPEYWV